MDEMPELRYRQFEYQIIDIDIKGVLNIEDKEPLLPGSLESFTQVDKEVRVSMYVGHVEINQVRDPAQKLLGIVSGFRVGASDVLPVESEALQIWQAFT